MNIAFFRGTSVASCRHWRVKFGHCAYCVDGRANISKDEITPAVWPDRKIHNLHSLETDDVCLGVVDKTNDPGNFRCRIILLGKRVSIFPRRKISSVYQDLMSWLSWWSSREGEYFRCHNLGPKCLVGQSLLLVTGWLDLCPLPYVWADSLSFSRCLPLISVPAIICHHESLRQPVCN